MTVRDLLRDGRLGEVGPQAALVYLVLRDRAWRSEDAGRSELRRAVARGELAASIPRALLERLSGGSRMQVRRALRDLEQRGWVRVSCPPGQQPSYQLGFRDGAREVWFAEGGGIESAPSPEVPTGIKIDPSPREDEGDQNRTPPPVLIPGEGSKSNRGRDQNRTGGGIKIEQGEGSKSTPSTRRGKGEEGKENSEGENTEPPQAAVGGERKVRRVRKSDPPPAPVNFADMIEQGTLLALEPRAAAPKAKLEQVEDPQLVGRLIDPDELRHLMSARAKAARGERGRYSGDEAVAAWRFRFVDAFGVEDPDLTTRAARARAARLFVQRARGWCEGDAAKLFEYLAASIKLWSSKPEGAKSPPGNAPRLATLLKHDKDGPSWFWREWSVKQAKVGR